MYFAQFDAAGNRITSYNTTIHKNIPGDAIQISDEDQAKYASGAYTRDRVTGRPVEKPGPTAEEQQAAIQVGLTAAVQSFMDDTARDEGYDNLLSAVTYAEESAVPAFQAEGKAFRAWRSLVWAYCYQRLAAVQGGQPVPTPEELVADLPPLVLP